ALAWPGPSALVTALRCKRRVIAVFPLCFPYVSVVSCIVSAKRGTWWNACVSAKWGGGAPRSRRRSRSGRRRGLKRTFFLTPLRRPILPVRDSVFAHAPALWHPRALSAAGRWRRSLLPGAEPPPSAAFRWQRFPL